MKKKFVYIAAIVTALAVAIEVVVGCVNWYKSSTSPNTSISNNNSISSEIRASNEPIFNPENYPQVDASLAIHPLMDSIASDFLGIEESELDFKYTETRTS